jgi:competence protein ComEA
MKRAGWKDYFTFTRKEQIAIVALILLIVFLLLVPYFIKDDKLPPLTLPEFADTVPVLTKDDSYNEKIPAPEPPVNRQANRPQLFLFDPNTVSLEGWIKLGISERAAQMILKYRSKGGRFYKAADISRIYGLRPSDINRLLPYVRIASNEEQKPGTVFSPAERYRPPRKTTATVEINAADSAALVALPGIGPALARRILIFRNKLGGFRSVMQVSETYGLPDSTFGKIRYLLRCDSSLIHKLNINTATKEELGNHPYVRHALANAIVQYRSQHGEYNSLEELSNLLQCTSEIMARIAPYLKVH